MPLLYLAKASIAVAGQSGPLVWVIAAAGRNGPTVWVSERPAAHTARCCALVVRLVRGWDSEATTSEQYK